MPIHLSMTYGCHHITIPGLNSCDKDHVALKAQNNYFLPFLEKVCWPLIKQEFPLKIINIFLASFKVFFFDFLYFYYNIFIFMYCAWNFLDTLNLLIHICYRCLTILSDHVSYLSVHLPPFLAEQSGSESLIRLLLHTSSVVATVNQRLDWGWRIQFQSGQFTWLVSSCWLLAGGLSSLYNGSQCSIMSSWHGLLLTGQAIQDKRPGRSFSLNDPDLEVTQNHLPHIPEMQVTKYRPHMKKE